MKSWPVNGNPTLNLVPLGTSHLAIARFAAFKILRDNGGELRGKYVIDKIRETVEFNEHEKLKDEQKSMMPIQQISFLGGNE